MRLYPRRKKSGERVWWASWTEDGVTVRRSTRCSTKFAAELVVARWERERADPVYAAAQGATFGVEAGMFLTSCESAVSRGKMAPGTLSMYRQKAGTLVRILGSSTRLGSFDGATFASYLETRRAEYKADAQKDIAESTLYKEWVTFRGILRQAWRAQRFGRDPASLKPAHFGPEYKPRETALTWAEVEKLFSALPSERRGPVAFALMTGARRKEVFVAEAEDLDAKRWTVRIRGTKTDAAAAIIPVPSIMRPLVVYAVPPFARWQNARRGLARACKRAGIPAVTWNDLRRTFASLLVQAGVAPHIVAKLLRHKTTAMVDKVYGRQTTESLAELLAGQLVQPVPAVRRFAKLSVTGEAPARTVNGKRYAMWHCICDCGNETVALAENVKAGRTTSCGCTRSSRLSTSGLPAKSPEYRTWQGIKQRCGNPKSMHYEEYGARGITVCPRWAASFDAFLADMGRRPGRGYSIDRINNTRGYEPGNCRWATAEEQAANRRIRSPAVYQKRRTKAAPGRNRRK